MNIIAILAFTAAASNSDTCRMGDRGCEARCEAGDAHACLVWGNMLVSGVGVTQDAAKGDVVFIRGCRKGDAESCNAHGIFVRERALDGQRDWDSVLAFFEKACVAGSSKGCNNAAAILIDGRVEGRDAKEGVAMLRKSCELDDAGSGAGCFAYGEALRAGKVVARDEVLAAKWLARACRAGVSEGCEEASDLGVKVELSPEMTLKIDQRKCDGDDAKACARYGARVLASASPARAVEPLRLACLGGEAKSCSELGSAMLFGKVKGSVDEGWTLLDKACALDDASSCRKMGDAMLVGHFVVRDEDAAKRLMKKACNLGDGVGCAHASGLALGKSAKRPVEFTVNMVLGKDCKAGDAEACTEVAGLKKLARPAADGVRRIALDDTEHACEDDATAKACYEAGAKYVKHDDDKARYYFDLGCKAGYPKACAEAGKYLTDMAAVDAFARGCSLGNAEACERAAKAAKKLGGSAVARARPQLEQACSARVAPACEAAGRLE